MQDAAPGFIQSIGQIHISVNDFNRARDFYKDVLQLPMIFDIPEQKMAFFDCGGVRIYLGAPSSPEYAANSFLYYRVKDIKTAHQSLSQAGVEFLHDPHVVNRAQDHELWMAGFQDSEGNYAQLMEERALPL